MKPRNSRVLVLNSDYTSHSIIKWSRAVKLCIDNQENPKIGAQAIDFYKDDHILDSKGRKHPIPAVVVLAQFVKKKRELQFGRKNVFVRDKLECQYCGQRFAPWELTYDHVIPRAQWDKANGTPTQWTNIVTCCHPCNKKKADKTPKQAGMTLRKQPIAPSSHNHIHGFSAWNPYPEEWEPYLPKMYKEFMKIRKNGV